MPCTLFYAFVGLILFATPLAAGDHTGCEFCLGHRLEAARWASDDTRALPGFDPETGRSTLNYPPHRHVHYHHMRLEIDIPDMNTPRLDAMQTLTFTPIARALESLSLNAALLDIHEVVVGGRAASFDHDGATLTITLDPPIPAGVRTSIVTSYTVNDPPFGLFWTLRSSAWPGRAPQIHTQGQPQDNRYWFPMHDFPNVRLTTELVVTVPAGFHVISNGRLVDGPPQPDLRRPGRHRDGERSPGPQRDTWHWLQDKPHVTYLVSLIVGQFDVVDVARPRRDTIPMPVYVPHGRAADVAGTYGRTPQMMDLFTRIINEPYPWDQYAQTIVWNFNHGGMENTGATTMHDTAILSPRGLADADIEGLISHELAHQWFGNLITCNSWEHIWLNEGFATYFTNLWFEERDGRDAYFDGVIGNFDRVTNADRADAPFTPAMASKAYDDPWEVFRRAANPYPKGAAILHMLRQKLGDELFYGGIALYVDRHRNTSAETRDLRTALEDVSGENLEQFFRQWVFRPGVPHLDITLDWDSRASELVISTTQSQNIDGYNPAFEFSLPIWVRHGPRDDQITIIHLEIHERETRARFAFEDEPSIVAIDPEMTLLARTSIRQPVRRWVAQLERGPTLFARVRAARALSDRNSALAGAVLLRQASEMRNHTRLRVEATRALGRAGHTGPLIELATMRGPVLDPPDLRLAMVEAVAQAARRQKTDPQHRGRLKELLIRHASPQEPSYRTRAAAIIGLGRLGASDQLRLIVAGAESESQHDRVRQASLEALGELGRREGLAVAIRYALPGVYNRTRPVAMRAIVRLAEHDRDSSFQLLSNALHDRERRAWQAAGEALVELGDTRAVEHFEHLLQHKRDGRDRRRIQEWIDGLRSHPEAPTAEPPQGEPAEPEPHPGEAPPRREPAGIP